MQIKVRIIFKFSAAAGLTEEQQSFQTVALEFAKQEMAPRMREWDEEVRLTQTLVVGNPGTCSLQNAHQGPIARNLAQVAPLLFVAPATNINKCWAAMQYFSN